MSQPRGPSSSTQPPDFDRIFEDHYDSAYRTILARVQDPSEAEDLTQETLLRVFRGLPNFRGEAALRSWVLRIAKNVVLDRHRRRARRPGDQAPSTSESELEDLPDATEPTPAQAVQRRSSGDCIRGSLQTLPEPYREAVDLHDLEGLTNPEIADLLDLSLATVKIRVHRARQQLREACEKDCRTYRDERDELACQPKKRSSGS